MTRGPCQTVMDGAGAGAGAGAAGCFGEALRAWVLPGDAGRAQTNTLARWQEPSRTPPKSCPDPRGRDLGR